MDALYRTGVQGLLDLLIRRPPGVHDLGKSQGFIYRKDLGADFLAGAAGDAFIFYHVRGMVRHILTLSFILFPFGFMLSYRIPLAYNKLRTLKLFLTWWEG
jgi:hypothetical protein